MKFKILLVVAFPSMVAINAQDKALATIETSVITSKPISVIDYANTITQEDLKKLVYTLSSDQYEGRKTGEKGQKMAAESLKKAGILGVKFSKKGPP